MAHALLMKLFEHTSRLINLPSPLKQPGSGNFNGFKMVRILLTSGDQVPIPGLKITPLLGRIGGTEILQQWCTAPTQTLIQRNFRFLPLTLDQARITGQSCAIGLSVPSACLPVVKIAWGTENTKQDSDQEISGNESNCQSCEEKRQRDFDLIGPPGNKHIAGILTRQQSQGECDGQCRQYQDDCRHSVEVLAPIWLRNRVKDSDISGSS